ncbi:MAG: hypothetical protein IPG29_08820 [Sphingobacteriales bacterium]|nr:hypothetical protein [Sphingobacteriales bacterium]
MPPAGLPFTVIVWPVHTDRFGLGETIGLGFTTTVMVAEAEQFLESVTV